MGSYPSQFPLDYRLISITHIISMYVKLTSRRLYKYVNSIKVFPNTQFGFRKGFGTSDALLLLAHNLQFSLDMWVEFMVFSLNFSSTFDLFNHQDLLYKLKLMGIRWPAFKLLKNFQLILNSVFRQMGTSVNLNLWSLVYLRILFQLFSLHKKNLIKSRKYTKYIVFLLLVLFFLGNLKFY